MKRSDFFLQGVTVTFNTIVQRLNLSFYVYIISVDHQSTRDCPIDPNMNRQKKICFEITESYCSMLEGKNPCRKMTHDCITGLHLMIHTFA